MEVELKKRTPEEQQAHWTRTLAEYQVRIKELELALLSNVRQEAENARLLDVVKQVYLKHCTDSEQAMGWDELGDLLYVTLCNAMGDDGYLAWMERIGHENS